MAVTEAQILALEEAMQHFGITGVTVDGDPADLQDRLVPFLNAFSQAVTSDGSLAQGEVFTNNDLYDPAMREVRIGEIVANIQVFRNSPEMGLVREILSDGPTRDDIEMYLTAIEGIDIDDPSRLARDIARGLNLGLVTPHEVLYGGGHVDVEDSLIVRAERNPDFAALRAILGDAALDDVERTVELLTEENIDAWFEVIEDIAPEPIEDQEERAEIVQGLDAEDEAERQAEEAARAAAEQEAADRLMAVETVLVGADAADGVWGDEERAALIVMIQGMQTGARETGAWDGPANGIYTDAFRDFVLAEDSPFSDDQRQLFEQLAELDNDGHVLVNADDIPVNSADVQAAISGTGDPTDLGIEGLLQVLTPYVQSQLDAEIARAEALIETIESGRASPDELQAAASVLEDPDASEEDKEEAREYLRQTGVGENIAAFIDEFLLLGQHDWGSQLVEAGQRWAVETIRGRIAAYNDLPSVDSFTIGDGRLDIHEQTALQGILFLMAEELGIPGEDNWRYTPQLGEAILSRLPSLPLEQKEELILMVLGDSDVTLSDIIEGYDDLSDVEKNEQLGLLITENLQTYIDHLDTAYEAGILTQAQLYMTEDMRIPPLTEEIFSEFVQGHNDSLNSHYEQDAATADDVAMLNLLVHEFTEGLDLADLQIEGFEPMDTDIFGTDAESIAARFQEMYREDVDLEKLGQMVETLPFGTDTRRQMFRTLLQEMEEQERQGTTVAILATMFGEGIVAINEHAGGGSGYIYVEQRPITIDPRLDNFSLSVDGAEISAEEIFALHRAENNNFEFGQRYQPSYFRAEDGNIYVAAIDIESRVFQIEQLDLDGWRTTVASNPDGFYEALEDVSGYALIFQNMDDPQFRAMYGYSPESFPDDFALDSVPSLSEFQSEVSALARERTLEDLETMLEAARPPGVGDDFSEAADPASGSTPEPRAPSLDEYGRNFVDRSSFRAVDGTGSLDPSLQFGVQGQ